MVTSLTISKVWVGHRNLVRRLISCRVHESGHQVKTSFSPCFLLGRRFLSQHFVFQRRILVCEDTQCGLWRVRPYCSHKVTSAFSRNFGIKLTILNLQCNSNGSVLLEPDDVRPKPVHGSHPPLFLYTGDLSCRILTTNCTNCIDCMNERVD